MPPSLADTIVVISDFRDGWPPEPIGGDEAEATERWLDGRRGPPPGHSATHQERADLAVTGGYLERLPLAAIKAGLVGRAEIWHHWRPSSPPPFSEDHPLLARRAFHLDGEDAPFRSTDMLGFIAAHGAPKILCVWGLGVDERILEACRDSFKIYNSIDAPAFRVPDQVGRHFDLVLTGAEWQSDEVRARLPGMNCLVLPIGPEFADPQTFQPLGTEKLYDLVYVAAAQGYKRHDILFDALERRPGTRALCVFGYGEMADDLRRQAGERRLDVTFVGPPGVPFAQVNALMNQARIGVVCGIDDGAPAILTEYMLAGLPVLANAGLRCGLQYITPETGMAVEPERFSEGIDQLLAQAETMHPRDTVLANWTWQASIAQLAKHIPHGNQRSSVGLLFDGQAILPRPSKEIIMVDTPTSPGNAPDGLREANDEGAGINLQSHAQDAKPSDRGKSQDMGHDRSSVEKDAQGQFTQSQHGGENNGVSSASPRVTTGTDDATFENDPGN